MKKYTLPLIFCICFLLGCGPDESTDTPGKTLIPTKGNRFYGGVFNLNESEYIKNLFPLNIIDIYSYRVASQIYEGLLKFDHKDLSVIPALAESYEVDDTRTVYTFKLKQGVFFHDDVSFPGGKGREFKATDVEYCFRRLCTESRENNSFSLFDGIVKGARAYYNATKGNNENPNIELEGVKVLDDYTIQITLEKPNSIFLYNLCRPGAFIYPREAYDYHRLDMREKCVGTGPFTLASLDEDISIILRRNPNYHRKDEFGNQLPFLEVINIQFLRDKKVELLEFKKGNLDMMYRLPTEYIIEILESAMKGSDGGYSQYDLQRTPEMSTQIISMYNQGEIFKDVNVRKAFNFAINRERILNNVLNGEGYEYGKYGITPPSFKNYDVAKIKGYEFNVDSARYYLKKAGYKNGQGFPVLKLDLNAEGERYTNVAVDIKKQLKDNLNIDIELNIAPLAKITEKSTSGNYDFLRLAWIGDYPSPENFLWFFYGKNVPTEEGQSSYPNLTRYQNPKFDELYEKGLNAISEEEALSYFMQAEQVVMNDAPIIVLWYDEGYRLMQSYVKNFPNNPLQYRDFGEVYLDFGNTTNEQ
ncbi:MAG: ABC transporter substrate-binding protein [Flammeovirgaceae bacterium]